MARERISTRADDDTVDALNDFVESDDTPDITKSEALRRFIREGLANRDYPVPAADGGTADRLDALERKQNVDALTHDVALLIGVAYIAATLTLDVGGLLWLGAGVIVLALVIFGSYTYRMQVGQ